ncbi:Bifunctional protein FolD [Chromobacterium violaceum]|uniref:methenyltetrahydrofolate cyclohydrolase n=1 Tax=Chromobacterium violaceum TaxID=536 RepID=A0A447TBP5_CHRVL|nr:Bifunctional protein FolD [Chromobacterium violaceum]
MGIPNFVKGEWVKPGAVVIDVGINRLDTASCAATWNSTRRANAPASLPRCGRRGPMTVATLLQNTLDSANLNA